jgi:sulfur-oxidizing protein SoxZ
MSDIKIRAALQGDVCEVKALMNHPMETGLRKDAKTGELVPAHFIKEVLCEHNGKVVMTAQWGGGVSKNPYLSFKIKGAKVGDSIKLSWTDNKGAKDSNEAKVG